jgi:hypothetical protein
VTYPYKPLDGLGWHGDNTVVRLNWRDIRPLNNLRLLQYLTGERGVDVVAKNTWYRHWLHTGLAAVEGGGGMR